jgi:hemerythrin
MAYIDWQQKYSVNVEIIDVQHRHFVDLLNSVYSSVQDNRLEKLGELIDELVEYAKLHFETEEKYFKKFHYEGASEHIIEHKKLIAEVSEFLDKKDNDPIILGYALVDFLEDWLVNHLAVMDQKYSECFKSHGL